MMKFTYLFIMMFFLNLSQAQEKINYTETEAIITKINSKRSGRTYSTTVIVKFSAKTGENITSSVRTLNPFKEVGESITVLYDPNNPFLLKSKDDYFLETYGLYFLIGLGVLFSFYNLKTYNKQKIKKS